MPAKVVKAAAVLERLEPRSYEVFALAWTQAHPEAEADMRLLFQRALEQLQGLENGRVLPQGHELLQPTMKKTALPDGRDRNTWRQEQVRKALSAATPQPKGKRVAYFVGGGMSTGKSTTLRWLEEGGAINLQNMVRVNADRFKEGDGAEVPATLRVEGIPEFEAIIRAGDVRAGDLTHEESSEISWAVLKGAMSSGRSFVYDASLSNPQSALELMDAAQAASYRVVLIGVGAELGQTWERALARGKQTGRYVRPSLIVNSAEGFNEGFERLAQAADEAMFLDTTGDRAIIARKRLGGSLEVTDKKRYHELGIGNEQRQKANN
jgi:hypothetical protein